MLSNPWDMSSGGSSAPTSISTSQQIMANRIGVFRAIQPVQRRPVPDSQCASADA